MAKVDRNNPKRGTASESSYSMMEFMQQFADDAACLDWLFRQRHAPDGSHAFCPKCDRERKFHRVKDRPAYDCDTCGYHRGLKPRGRDRLMLMVQYTSGSASDPRAFEVTGRTDDLTPAQSAALRK